MAHNPTLADTQGVPEFDRKIIDKLHILRYLIEENVKELLQQKKTPERDEIIRKNYSEWFENERILQDLWKFPQDDNFIKFWAFPACTCPKMDNDDNFPAGRYVQTSSCIIHGWDTEK